MNKEEQKAEERKHTISFLNALFRDFDESKLFEGNDPPDFYFSTLENNKIAIEHTRIIKSLNNRNLAHYYKKIDQLINDAQKIFKEINPNDQFIVQISISGIDLNSLDRAQEKLYSMKLAELIQHVQVNYLDNSYLRLNTADAFDLSFDSNDVLVTNYFEELHITEVIIGKSIDFESSWKRDKLVLYGELKSSDLFEAIKKKNIKLVKNQWGNDFLEKWLLLVITGENWSNFSTHEPKGSISHFELEFDKVFIFSYPNKKILALK